MPLIKFIKIRIKKNINIWWNNGSLRRIKKKIRLFTIPSTDVNISDITANGTRSNTSCLYYEYSISLNSPDILLIRAGHTNGSRAATSTDFGCYIKSWKYENGWQMVVDFLNDNGYKVIVISKERTSLNNVIDKNSLKFPLVLETFKNNRELKNKSNL